MGLRRFEFKTKFFCFRSIARGKIKIKARKQKQFYCCK